MDKLSYLTYLLHIVRLPPPAPGKEKWGPVIYILLKLIS